MQVNYTNDAFAALMKLVNFIERKNTSGAGLRWLERYEHFLAKKLLHASQIKLCNNATFQRLNLRCLYFNDWVIAFSVGNSFILIEAVFHRSRIAD